MSEPTPIFTQVCYNGVPTKRILKNGKKFVWGDSSIDADKITQTLNIQQSSISALTAERDLLQKRVAELEGRRDEALKIIQQFKNEIK